MQMTLVANAGILISYGTTKILLDGIYGKEGHRFSNLKEHTWQEILNGTGIFSNITYLLFSHEHGDHFSPDMVKLYLKKQRPQCVFLPEGGSCQQESLEEYIKEEKIPCVVFSKKSPQYRTYHLGEHIKLKAYAMVHQGKIFEEIPHFCFLLSIENKNFLFTVDIDFVNEDFSLFQNIELEAIFINPLFFHSKEGQAVLQNIVKPKKIVVYHIPFAEDDVLHMRKMVERNKQQWQNTPVVLLEEEMQTIQW